MTDSQRDIAQLIAIAYVVSEPEPLPTLEQLTADCDARDIEAHREDSEPPRDAYADEWDTFLTYGR